MSLADFLADGSVMAEIFAIPERNYVICGEMAKFNLHIYSRDIPLMSFKDRIGILSDDAMSIEILDVDHDEQELTKTFSRLMQSTESLLSIDSNISKFSNSNLDLSNISDSISNEKNIQLQNEYSLIIPFEVFIETDLQFSNALCHVKIVLLEAKRKRGSKETIINRNILKLLNDQVLQDKNVFKKIKSITKTFKLVRSFSARLDVVIVREYEAILTVILENIGPEPLKIIKMNHLITDLKYNRIGTSKMDILSDYFIKLIPFLKNNHYDNNDNNNGNNEDDSEMPFDLQKKCLMKSCLKLITEPSFIPREFWQKPVDLHLKTNIEATIGDDNIPIYLGFTSPIPMNKIFDASFGKKIMSIRFDVLDTNIKVQQPFNIRVTVRNNTMDDKDISIFFPLMTGKSSSKDKGEEREKEREREKEEFPGEEGTIISLEPKIGMELIKVNMSKSVVIQALALVSGYQFMNSVDVYNEHTKTHHVIHRPIRVHVLD